MLIELVLNKVVSENKKIIETLSVIKEASDFVDQLNQVNGIVQDIMSKNYYDGMPSTSLGLKIFEKSVEQVRDTAKSLKDSLDALTKQKKISKIGKEKYKKQFEDLISTLLSSAKTLHEKHDYLLQEKQVDPSKKTASIETIPPPPMPGSPPMDTSFGLPPPMDTGLPPPVVKPNPTPNPGFGLPPPVVRPNPTPNPGFGLPPPVVKPNPTPNPGFGLPPPVVKPNPTPNPSFGLPPPVTKPAISNPGPSLPPRDNLVRPQTQPVPQQAQIQQPKIPVIPKTPNQNFPQVKPPNPIAPKVQSQPQPISQPLPPPEEEIPPPPPEEGEWLEALAPDGRTYYYNTVTRETSWSKPY